MGENPPEFLSLGTFSKVGSFGQFLKITTADITVVNTMKRTH